MAFDAGQTGKACIIGAGCSGFTMAKRLKDHGVPYDCFELSDNIGGWGLNTIRCLMIGLTSRTIRSSCSIFTTMLTISACVRPLHSTPA